MNPRHAHFPTALSTATKPTDLPPPPNETTDETPLKRSVRLIREQDLLYLTHLQRVWSHNLGFLPKQAHARYARLKQGLVVLENNTPAGYLIWTISRKRLLRIIQVAVEPELLRTTIGTKVMRTIERAAAKQQCSALRLTSMANLPANLFWPELGFHSTLILTPESRKGLPHIEWTKQLVTPADVVSAYTARARTRGLRPSTGSAYAPAIIDEIEKSLQT